MISRVLQNFNVWCRGLDKYWFGYQSPTTLGLFRIVMSSLIFINFLMILTDFETWFGERGFVPERIGRMYLGPVPLSGRIIVPFDLHIAIPRINFLAGNTDDRISLAVYLIVLVFTLLCAVGFWTRLSSVIMAVGIVTLHHRNGLILHGGDTVVRICALYIAMAPSGAACSLDRMIGLWKGTIKPGPVRVSVWVQRLVSFNVGLIYFTTFWHKFGYGNLWRDFTATWYPARLHEFDRFPVPSFMNQLPFVYFATAFTLITELSLGTLVFYRPLRKWILLMGVMLHAYIDYSMNIPLFSFLIVSMYISFYDGTEVEDWAKRLGQRLARFRAVIRLPAQMRFREGPGSAILAADPLGLLQYLPGSSPSWEAEKGGKPANPFRTSLSRSVGAWPIGVVPYLWRKLLNNSLETAPADEISPPSRVKKKVKT